MTIGAGIARTKLPPGFYASGINCGVRRYRPDLGLITSEFPATAVAVYTQNTCVGAPIKYCKSVLPTNSLRAIVTNSGQANTATGEKGLADNWKMVEAVAHQLGISSDQVASASTGVIGKPLEIEKIVSGVSELVENQIDSAEKFATAIMTTDLVPKTASIAVELSTGTVQITGIAKGSGMIHPNMATMLGYFLTDLQLDIEVAQELLVKAVDPTFNMISVDGEPSTNDTVFLMANGSSKVSLQDDSDYALFLTGLKQVGEVLAKSIARDGEGASKLLQVTLSGAPTKEKAIQWARSLTVSPLIKTAIHGNDPNWGRIVGRLGAEGVPSECFDLLSLDIQGVPILSGGSLCSVDLNSLSQSLKTDEVKINIDLKVGEESAVAWGCDLSKKYVTINAEYTT